MYVITPAEYRFDANQYRGAVFLDGEVVPGSLRSEGVFRHVEDAPSCAGDVIPDGAYAGRFFRHFGHFLVETMPSLWAARNEPHIIMHPWPGHRHDVADTPHAFFTLRAFEIDRSSLTLITEASVAADVKILPPAVLLGEHPVAGMEEAFQTMARKARQVSGADYGERIYMSRKAFSGNARKVSGEEEAERIFEERGFRIMYPETVPFRDQIAAVSKAKVVAGIDGSALHLCGFMNGGQCLVLPTRQHIRAIETVNNLAGVETVWLDGVVRREPELALDADAIRRAL